MGPRPWFVRALLVTLVFALLLVFKDWAYEPTFRLFLDQQRSAERSTATQQFDIESGRVVPLIHVTGPDRVAFATDVRWDSTVQVDLRVSRPTHYAIEWRAGSATRVLTEGTASAPTSVACAYPTGSGVIEFVSDGAATWVDPRVVRDLPLWPYAWASLFLALTWLAWRQRGPQYRLPEFESRVRLTAFKWTAATISLLAALAVSEVALCALSAQLPNGMVVERHDLGEVTADPHWGDSPHYGRRLRASVDTLNEWREGDIVRMGFIPPPAVPGPLHRFAFHTDAEGFRNHAVRDRFDIAALGDSFTDAMTMAAEHSWPVQLEQISGASVQNYGIAGFGPQQELLVLKEAVAPHRPRTVVLAFFAGNDIFDSEAFDKFQKSGGLQRREAQGWRIKSVVSRADQWFVTSALRAGGNWLNSRTGPVSAAEANPAPPVVVAAPPPPTQPTFDRGIFSVPVAGHVLQWAFMPPYLNTLNFSREQIAARPGWRLTREAILDMQTTSASFGANFVVMFIPFKSQVYLPLLDRHFSREQLQAAFGYSIERYGPVVVDRMYANRLAQNELMQRFCAEAGIPFLDLTPIFSERVESTGENVYFPDESHLNEAGEALVAERLAAFLADLSKPRW
jgi:lysophospholipase L1-like esterase